MKLINNNKGFSLLEVIGAIVIISIVLASFSQLIIQSNNTAHKNNEKLVVINLADAALAKLRASTFKKNASYTDVNQYFIDNTQSDPLLKSPPTAIQLNGKTYTVSYSAQQQTTKQDNNMNNSESDLGLINVVVTVTSPDGKTKSSTEGYVSLE